MRLVQFAAASLLALAGCDSGPPGPNVSVEEAWVQLPAVPGRPGAAYFTLVANEGPARLVSVSSPRVQRIELHGTSTENGVARMRPLENPAFPDDLELVFAPGGNHAMLFELDPALKPGDRIPLTFTFDPAPPVTVDAKARAFSEGHGGH